MISEPFIRRPVATTLLTIALAIGGVLAFSQLRVAPLPQVAFPTIQVNANLPGASPETMASAVATPLERQFGRIAGVTEMTSSSSLGSTNVTLQFELSRDVDAAARDVQAAINAARGQLPANLPSNPNYRKVNPADAPAVILALTSNTVPRSTIYDITSTVLAQSIAQVTGVGQVNVGGGALPAVRVELNPNVLNKYGISLEQVRTVLGQANANTAKGQVADERSSWEIHTDDQLFQAVNYMPLIVAARNGSIVRLADLGEVTDSVENIRVGGMANGKPAVLVFVMTEPAANVIDTVDRVLAELPRFRALLPADVDLQVAVDRTTTIRASVHDVERTLVIAIVLVILVVFVFLRNGWATFIPGVAVPLSLLGTFGAMWFLGYSLDNLSLMALTISTGFVVDDAIVVLENITRHLDDGMDPLTATLVGSKEIGFTVLSMSLSLIAVFIPLLFMGGIVGRLFREFAVTLSVAVAISLVVSLTTTPMLCAKLLHSERGRKHGKAYAWIERSFNGLLAGYDRSLWWVLRHWAVMLAILLVTIGLNWYLFSIIPKGFFPQQDNGMMFAGVQASQATSFQAMRQILIDDEAIVRADPAIASVVAFTGGGNSARMFIALKPLADRKLTADQVIARLRPKFAHDPRAGVFMQAAQDIRVGGRGANAQYQYTLQGDDLDSLNHWAPLLTARLQKERVIADVNADQQNAGLQASVEIDRDTAARMGITAGAIDQALYDAFGQRQVSTMYAGMNQYRVVMEVAEQYWQHPETLDAIYVAAPGTVGASGASGISGTSGASGISGTSTTPGTLGNSGTPGTLGTSGTPATSGTPGTPGASTLVPLSSVAKFGRSTTPLAVNHQGQFPAITLSFNLMPGASLGDAVAAIDAAARDIGMPTTIHGSFQGTAQAFQASLANEPWLILAAVVTVYIVLGILYESLVHPLTILSTLPSAGVGATFALLATNTDFTIIALIGLILLIGIVKKNAIMMIDFALVAERTEGLSPMDAIHRASVLRFRPILMTTMAAILGALPIALGTGTGSELRRPLGISIVGGLLVSQLLTLYTTPVIYLVMDRMRLRFARRRGRLSTAGAQA